MYLADKIAPVINLTKRLPDYYANTYSVYANNVQVTIGSKAMNLINLNTLVFSFGAIINAKRYCLRIKENHPIGIIIPCEKINTSIKEDL